VYKRQSVFRPYFRWQRDRLVTTTAVAAVVAFGMIDGLLASIAFSLAMLLRSLSSPRLSVLGRLGTHDFVSMTRFPDAVTAPGTLVPVSYTHLDVYKRQRLHTSESAP